MADDKGTECSESLEGCSEWFLDAEAECEDGLDSLERLFEDSTDGSIISDLIDDGECNQGNTLALFNKQLLQDNEQHVGELKRKYLSPSPKHSVLDLSPKLQSVSLSPQKRNSKRRLFQDSGVGNSFANETEDATPPVLQEVASIDTETGEIGPGAGGGSAWVTQLLRSNNRTATALSKIKQCFGIGFTELTRPFKSDKTCSQNWVVAVLGINEDVMEGSKTLLKQHCDYMQLMSHTCSSGVLALYLLELKVSKSRETLHKLLVSLLCVNACQLVSNPPKNRSVPVALYFYKASMSNVSYKYGVLPDWLAKQTLVNHQSQTETFELARMVQWAYDNDYTEESEIAYNYALCAEEDANAAAWLKSNAQAKFLRDCVQMVRLYRRHEMRQMSFAQWIKACCDKVEGIGDWTEIIKLLKYQGVNVITFLAALRHLIQCTPKKQCIVIQGPPDTGKSYFCTSLVRFLRGKVISFVNSKSHFWLQPLVDAKIGYLDDATTNCWYYFDTYMRTALDGQPVSVDLKHRSPLQVRLPPMLITTNVPIDKEQKYRYLHSRVTTFHFPEKFPFEKNGDPVFALTDQSWKSFFERLAKQLAITADDEGEDGDPVPAFRCVAGTASEPL
nr:MAG: E1 protein [Varecia variegata papillomavirus 2]